MNALEGRAFTMRKKGLKSKKVTLAAVNPELQYSEIANKVNARFETSSTHEQFVSKMEVNETIVNEASAVRQEGSSY